MAVREPVEAPGERRVVARASYPGPRRDGEAEDVADDAGRAPVRARVGRDAHGHVSGRERDTEPDPGAAELPRGEHTAVRRDDDDLRARRRAPRNEPVRHLVRSGLLDRRRRQGRGANHDANDRADAQAERAPRLALRG